MSIVSPVRIRLLLAAVALLTALAWAPAARAGTYVVRSCGSDGVNRSFVPAATAGMDAYVRCPGLDFDGRNTGLVAHAVHNGGGGWVPLHSSAWEIFEAPGGATVQSLTFRASTGRSSGCWSIGLFGWDGDAFHPGDHLWGYGANCSTAGGGYTYFLGPYTVDAHNHQKVRVGVRCDSGGGCPTSGSVGTWANLEDVAVTVRNDSAPSVSPNGGTLFGDGWHRGIEDAWAAYRDDVGVRRIYGLVDGSQFAIQEFTDPGWPAWVACDFARSRPCQDIPNGGLELDTKRLADGAHALRLAGDDAAGNTGVLDRTIRVDNHAPAAPRDPVVVGGEGWRAANGFDVAWANPSGQVAPIVGAHWRLCPSGGPASACILGSRDGQGISRLDGLRPPSAGDWTLEPWLEDEAGNADPAHAADRLHLRLDDVAPRTPGFELLDPTDPRRLALPVADDHSGVASVAIELRERGSLAWEALPTRLGPDGRAVAEIPDTRLPDGAYEVRAVIRDAAGNETVADRDLTGRPMSLALPLRVAARIVGRPMIVRRCRTVLRRSGRRTISRRICARVPARGLREVLRVPFGRASSISGTLVTWQGRPVSGAVVQAVDRPRTASSWRAAGAVRTGADGSFRLRIAPGPSRTLRLVYPGTALLLPATLDARVLVPAAGTLRSSRRRARNGQSVVFSGRLLGRPLPRGGRTVDLQAHYRGAWRTFATPRTDALGRWRRSYHFGATRGRVVYRFRALIKRDAAYPYEQGVTRVVRVVVTG